jgi:tetratricopeptide (TPR) repeat protein
MIRWLISLLCVCFLWLGVIEHRAIAEPVSRETISEEQLQAGEAIAQKAIAATKQGNFIEAENYWTQLIQQFPYNPAVWSNRGNVRIIQDKLKQAISDFNHSIQLAPDAPDPYLNRGIAYEAQQLWQEALDDYNRVLEINPQDAIAYNNRGNAKAGQGQWQEALADYQKAIEISPQFAFARGNAALATYQMGNKQEAVTQMRNLVRKYPMFSDMRAALTAALWVDGQQGEAESNWVAAVGLDNRYQSIDWVKNIRRWPPQMVKALERFLNLS